MLRDLTADRFRTELQRSNDPRVRYVVNFTRKAIFGGGGGHHFPIGGYLAAEDLVFDQRLASLVPAVGLKRGG